ncbi:MAG: molybdopterin-synthase adenylyltransferase MoeB [Vulcanimicrobiaceae bacterium]
MTSAELRRYSRHLLMPEVALAGQEKLRTARVLVVGAGGLGSPALAYLAAAGVGRLGIVDGDVVDLTNLQRQILFGDADLGKPKAEVAAVKLRALNPHVALDIFPLELDETNARDLIRPYDLVLDCTDRFATRYLINDACWFEGKPDVFASIFRFDGQVTVFSSQRSACYRCLFPQAPPTGSVPTCAEGGVLGVLPGIVGACQANEALKIILGIGEPLFDRLLLIDALGGRTRDVRYGKDPACALCGAHPRIHALRREPDDEVVDVVHEIGAEELDAAMDHAILLDVREAHEIVLGILPGALHIPASELESRLHDLDSARAYIVACRVGVKSRWAAQRLRDAGFTRVVHLRGGLLGYAALGDEFAFF